MALRELQEIHKELQLLQASLQKETQLSIRKHLHHRAFKLFNKVNQQRPKK